MSLKIALTQRVEFLPDIGETRDCLDQNWFSLLESFGFTPVPVPNNLKNIEQWCSIVGINGFILTGGNDLQHLENGSNIAPKRDETEIKIIQMASQKALPLLGVCRGMQHLNCFYKGNLTKIENHVATTHSLKRTNINSAFFPENNTISVNSYHNYGIKAGNLSSNLQPIYKDSEGFIEAMQHSKFLQAGIMWHPERNKAPADFDKQLIKVLFQ